MKEDFKMWLSKMYYENCKERDLDGVPLYESVDAYYQKHTKWLENKFNNEEGEK